MMGRIAFFDLDGTLSQGYISVDFMEYLRERGLFDAGEYARQQRYFNNMLNGKMMFEKWVRTIGGWGTGLKGMKEGAVKECAADFLEIFRPRIYDSSHLLPGIFSSAGFIPVLVSAGVSEVVSLAAGEIGIENIISTVLGVDRQGCYTGRLATSLHFPRGKVEAVTAMMNGYGVAPAGCAAFGDSVHDIPMLESVGYPFALNPSKELERAANERGWPCLSHESVLKYVRGWLGQC